MPWNNQSGGGGGPWGGGGNGGGPWGQGPRGPGGPQNQPPDLEDIIRKGQDRLKRALPTGGGFSPALLGLIALALIAAWFFKAVYTVQPDELAVELRFGKPKDVDAAFSKLQKKWARGHTISTRTRIDGRRPDEVRAITIETGDPDRVANMRVFAKRALELLADTIR